MHVIFYGTADETSTHIFYHRKRAFFCMLWYQFVSFGRSHTFWFGSCELKHLNKMFNSSKQSKTQKCQWSRKKMLEKLPKFRRQETKNDELADEEDKKRFFPRSLFRWLWNVWARADYMKRANKRDHETRKRPNASLQALSKTIISMKLASKHFLCQYICSF